MPILCIISGCNGAGKTTASYTVLPDMLDCKEFVNSEHPPLVVAKGFKNADKQVYSHNIYNQIIVQ